MLPRHQGDRKKTIINIQWLVVVATSYLLLFRKGEVVADPRQLSLIVTLLAALMVLYRMPQEVGAVTVNSWLENGKVFTVRLPIRP